MARCQNLEASLPPKRPIVNGPEVIDHVQLFPAVCRVYSFTRGLLRLMCVNSILDIAEVKLAKPAER